MTGLLRKAMLFACAGVLAASYVMAAVPDPTTSTVPCGINLVGIKSGQADVKGQFSVVVRDLAGNPIAGSALVLDFNSCEIDIRICTPQPGYTGGTALSADCTAPPGGVGSINAVTDGSGTANLRIVGGARNTFSHAPGEAFKCATLYADGVNLGNINIGAYDQDGSALWLSDSFSAPFEGRSDFNCTNTINPVDLALLLSVSIPGTSFNSCASYCH